MYCDEYAVCLFICLSACVTQKPHGQNVTKYFMHVACGCGSVLLRHYCDMLCTSGFTDGVMFSHHTSGQNQAQHYV